MGKSTLAVNVAAALADAGPVVLLDADAHGTPARWVGQGRLPVRCAAGGTERWIGHALAAAIRRAVR